MFSTLPRGSFIDERISRSYGKEVLLSNWQDLRLGEARQSNCIVPALKRVDACLRDVSEQKYNYMPITNLEDEDNTTRHFLEMRNEALHNYKRNVLPQFRQPFTHEFLNNFTSTYTISFDLLPRSVKASAKAMWKKTVKSGGSGSASGSGGGGGGGDDTVHCNFNVDMLQSYGNRDKTGSRCRRQEAIRQEKLQRLQTTYAAEYDANKLKPALV